MKLQVGKYVKVVKGTDETFDSQYLGMEGLIIDHNENGQTGNTSDDPLHLVQFDLNTVPIGHPQYNAENIIIESFWSEELEICYHNHHKLGIVVPTETYYQPVLTEQEMIQSDFYSFFVYRSKEKAKNDFPNKEIKEYSGCDIENPTFIDDPDSFTPKN